MTSPRAPNSVLLEPHSFYHLATELDVLFNRYPVLWETKPLAHILRLFALAVCLIDVTHQALLPQWAAGVPVSESFVRNLCKVPYWLIRS